VNGQPCSQPGHVTGNTSAYVEKGADHNEGGDTTCPLSAHQGDGSGLDKERAAIHTNHATEIWLTPFALPVSE